MAWAKHFSARQKLSQPCTYRQPADVSGQQTPQPGDASWDPEKSFDTLGPEVFPPLTQQQQAWVDQRASMSPEDYPTTKAEQPP